MNQPVAAAKCYDKHDNDGRDEDWGGLLTQLRYCCKTKPC